MSAEKDFILQLYIDLTGSELLHFGYWSDGDPVSWEGIPEAQERYAEFVFSQLPERVGSVLEVGCGTGEAAMRMKAMGLDVDCVSPDVLLAERIRRKYGDGFTLYCSRFEDLDTEKTYDLAMAMESFEYLKMDQALRQFRRYVRPGGHVLISDMFRTSDDPDYKSFHTIEAFDAAVGRHGFRVAAGHDITVNTAPTVELASRVFHRYAAPVIRTTVNSMVHSVERRKRTRRLQYTLWRLLMRLLRSPIRRARDRFENRIPRILSPENFLAKVRYMVYLLEAPAS